MSVRYLFNTSGQYVAFVSNQNVFDPNCEWLGFVTNGNEMYDTRGTFCGYILDDDRVARNPIETKLPMLAPYRPFKPMRPFNPLRRLRMAPLPMGYVDVFESKSGSSWGGYQTQEYARSASFPQLLGMYLFANDGTFLGTVSKNRFDQASMTNDYGVHGSPYSQVSIFNQYGPYGGPYSPLSPFNPYSSTPPYFQDPSGRHIGHLSVNKFVSNSFDANEFVSWLKR